MIKFTVLLIRAPSLSHAEFVEHHKGVHAGLFMSLPVVKATVRRYVQQHAIPAELPGMPPVKYDGITELWFADVDALARCFSDPEYMARVRPDEASFLDLHACEFVVSRENVVAD
ncbi:EthD domain-containing protein [uncultured Enterovirga sp.]|uniref:EthD domain-containing protein n=1 Tax=uncultured Enterovirga sp. TaxID=2026352 RepID=UPI0035CB5113